MYEETFNGRHTAQHHLQWIYIARFIYLIARAIDFPLTNRSGP